MFFHLSVFGGKREDKRKISELGGRPNMGLDSCGFFGSKYGNMGMHKRILVVRLPCDDIKGRLLLISDMSGASFVVSDVHRL